jgi:hypothetical protein
MHNFKSVFFASLVAGSLMPVTGLTADRDVLDDLKDRFERGRDQIGRERDRDRDRDRDRYDRNRERDRDRGDRDRRVERRERNGREDRVSGTVTDVNRRRQTFSIQEKDNDIVTVLVPSDIDSRDQERFSKLRKGENVRLAGRFERENRFKLEEFR